MHSIAVETESGAAVIHAEGELDAFVAPDLASAFESVDSSGVGGVVVDLRRVSFLDSTALGIVVRAVRELRERGSRVRVVLPRGAARRIFEITTLDRVLPVAGSRAQALSELERAS